MNHDAQSDGSVSEAGQDRRPIVPAGDDATIEISVAGVEQAEPLAELARRTFADKFSYLMPPAEMETCLETRLSVDRVRKILGEDTFLVARDADRMVGFIQVGEARPDTLDPELSVPDGALEIRRLYVLGAYQNRGIGSRLVDAALDLPAAAAAPAVFLAVWEDNDGARRFYERHGFEPCGAERPFYLESGEYVGADIVMVLRDDSRGGDSH